MIWHDIAEVISASFPNIDELENDLNQQRLTLKS